MTRLTQDLEDEFSAGLREGDKRMASSIGRNTNYIGLDGLSESLD